VTLGVEAGPRLLVGPGDGKGRVRRGGRQGHAAGRAFLLGWRPDLELWVPRSRRTSCDLLILVDEAAEAVASLDLV
jgi:hypothetical protein